MTFDNGLSRLIQGDCRDVLAALPEQSVHMVVTSPPYWGLRRYREAAATVWGGIRHAHEWNGLPGNKRHAYQAETSGKQAYEVGELLGGGARGDQCPQCGAWCGVLGTEPTPEMYVAHIVSVCQAIKRVLRDDGTFWLNLGTTMYGSGGANNNSGLTGRSIADGADVDERDGPRVYSDRQQPHEMWQPQCMVPVPWMVGLALIEDGWVLRSEIIWDKPAPMPESVTDRPTKSHEQILLLSKSTTPQYWTHRGQDGVRTPPPAPDYRWRLEGQERTSAPPGWQPRAKGCMCCGGDKASHWTRANLWEGHAYYYDAVAIREPGTDRGFADPDLEAGGRSARSIWRIAPEPSPEEHFAMYPSGLPRRCILAGTSEKGCCPECGAQWERTVEKSGGMTGKSLYEHGADLETGRVATDPRAKGGHGYKVVTLGWSPTCAHDAGPVPSTVLDPFAGTATTLAAAQELGRRSIGAELSPDYAEMAARRLSKVPLSFPGA